MIEPSDRSRRDSAPFRFTTKQLRDFIDLDHLMVRVDERSDAARLVEPLEDGYSPDNCPRAGSTIRRGAGA